LELDTYANDPGRWGASMANFAEIMLPCLDAVGARSVAEVGAYAGDLTGLLLQWAKGAGAAVTAIDPSPQEELEAVAAAHPELELIRETSHDALARIPLPDAIVLDGDHNYFTVGQELRIVAERAPGAELPLLLLHDVRWPHARRDNYYVPERIPDEHRQPIARDAGLFPGEPGLRDGGLPGFIAAEREGGPRNGVLTAVEDFVADNDGLRFAAVPAFFGLGVVWHRDAPWAGAVEAIVAQWDSHPLLERLEANRVLHLSSSHVQWVRASRLEARNAELEGRIARYEELLRQMLESRAFGAAERLSKLHQRGEPAFSREQVRRTLEE
jgi:SAM-dependent methyltransferase